MNIALVCDTWTIWSTLFTGVLLGIAILIGGVAAGIANDRRRASARLTEIQENRVGKIALADQPVYDHENHGI